MVFSCLRSQWPQKSAVVKKKESRTKPRPRSAPKLIVSNVSPSLSAFSRSLPVCHLGEQVFQMHEAALCGGSKGGRQLLARKALNAAGDPWPLGPPPHLSPPSLLPGNPPSPPGHTGAPLGGSVHHSNVGAKGMGRGQTDRQMQTQTHTPCPGACEE